MTKLKSNYTDLFLHSKKETNIFDNNILQRDEQDENMFVEQMIKAVKKHKNNKNIDDFQLKSTKNSLH